MSLIVSGEGDHGVLVDNRLALFPSREQAMAYVGLCLKLGLSPTLWELA